MCCNRLLFLIVTILIGGCSNDRDGDTSAGLPDAYLPGVYTGVFPCQNCQGIRTALWLRSDGRFFIRQTYLEDDGRDGLNAYNLGRWRWSSGDPVLILDGAGPGRMFTHPDRDTLIMQSDSDLEHRLSRDPTAADFSSKIWMTGMMGVQDGITSFTECFTGLVAPVEQGGDFARFLHQYRSVGAHDRPAYVEFEGRFLWAQDGSLKAYNIERFMTVKRDRSC